MQIVYLSNRPAVLAATLECVSRLMPFVHAVLAVVPASLEAAFRGIDCPLPIEIVFDEALAGRSVADLDHSSRNYLLRMSLAACAAADDEFIMSDDDARPLTGIDPALFKEHGKHHSFYFYDLRDWTYGSNSFDTCQRNTLQVLRHLDYPLNSFASHMPQIIDKEILGESRRRFERYADEYALCEWTTYFNYALVHHPHRFHPPGAYRTLGWPECASCWPKSFEPDRPLFENYAERHYRRHGAFHGLDAWSGDPQDLALKKMIRWQRYELEVVSGRRPDNPTPFRVLAYKLMRPLVRVKDVLWLKDSERLLNLAARVNRIEQSLLDLEAEMTDRQRR